MKRKKRNSFIFLSAIILAMLFFGGCAFLARLPIIGTGLSWLEEQLLGATVPLYRFTAYGSLEYTSCFVTAFRHKGGNVYLLITSASCVTEDDMKKHGTKIKQTPFFVSYDSPDVEGKKQFYPVKIVKTGNQKNGLNLAVLEVKTDEKIPVIPLAAFDPTPGEKVSSIFISSPGAGKSVLRGKIVLNAERRRYILEPEETNAPLSEAIPEGVIISRRQDGIVAFLVKKPGQPGVLVPLPVSKFKSFLNEPGSNNEEK